MLATPAWAQIETANGGHDGGPKAHEGGPSGTDSGNGRELDPDCMCAVGRLTPIGTDEDGNPSTATPGLGPDWDPHRDDVSAPDDPNIDWGWDE
jgi:hypothetical protein